MRPRHLAYLAALLGMYVVLRIVAAGVFYVEFRAVPWLDLAPRMPNVRALPPEIRQAAVRSFLSEVADAAPDDRPWILVAGDSQLYGYFLPSTDTMPRFLQEELPGSRVVNASRISGGFSHARFVLHAAADLGKRPRALVVGANPAIAAQRDQEPRSLGGPLPLALFLTTEISERFVDLAWQKLHQGRWTLDLHDQVFSAPGDGTYQLAALEPHYYPKSTRPDVERQLRELLADAREGADHVVMIVHPHYYRPYLSAPYWYDWDTSQIAARYMAICSEFANAICLDLSRRFGTDRFHDVVHLNRQGHRELARIVADALRAAQARQ